MLEYVFFQDEPRRRFIAFLQEQDLPWTQESRAPETLVVIDETDLDEDLADRVEALYDELFAMEQAIYDARPPHLGDPGSPGGLAVTLRDGHTVSAQVPPDVLERILQAVSPAELGILVDAVVAAVEGIREPAARLDRRPRAMR